MTNNLTLTEWQFSWVDVERSEMMKRCPEIQIYDQTNQIQDVSD